MYARLGVRILKQAPLPTQPLFVSGVHSLKESHAHDGVGVCADWGGGCVGCAWVADLRTGGQSLTGPVRMIPTNDASFEELRSSS